MFVTAVHKNDPLNSNSENKHDAAIVWAEDVTNQGFKACVRELKNFDGIHKNVQVVSTSALPTISVKHKGNLNIEKRNIPADRTITKLTNFGPSASNSCKKAYSVHSQLSH